MNFVAIVFLPLAGAAIAGLFGRAIGDRAAQAVTCVPMLLAAALAIHGLYDVAVLGNIYTVHILNWVSSGGLDFNWALKIDQLTAVMMFVVTVVSAMVHVYSIGYMHHDHSIPRFFSYLSLFTFFMLMLVTSDNLVQMYFGWEGVGLASYLLIGFWYDRPSANAAAIKAFVVNRIGDFGFALGIFAAFMLFGTVSLDVIFAAAPDKVGATFHFLGLDVDALTLVCLLLFVGAMGKSAQVPLHTWLPDAMEGPTPVSALIHAATMVTAGVFLVCRMSPVFEYAPVALSVVVFVGASTAFFAATVALTQNDIKRVIAYSTCSQLGYMFFAAGVGAYGAAMFHLTTHAFFKALLFLGAGSVIHAMSGEQDMRKMGGIWREIPVTYVLMWIGSLALAGVPFFAGFYSKDIILESAFAAGTGLGYYAFAFGLVAAVLTAFYSWRLIIVTFHGAPRAGAEVMSHVHESPASMIVPLLVLAAGAIFAGVAGYEYFVGHHAGDFWGKALVMLGEPSILEKAHRVPGWVVAAPVVAGLAGIGVAYALYMALPGLPARIAAYFHETHLFLSNKWYFDELYDAVLVRPALRLGRGLWKSGDGALIDGVGPDGVAAATRDIAKRFGKLQSGYVYHYAFAMLIGVVIFVTLYLYGTQG